MAFVEKRGQWYRVVFRHEGQRYTHTLKTQDREIADGILGGVQKTLMLLKQRVLHIPDGADVLDFVLSGGQVQNPPARSTEAETAATGDPPPETPITLQELQKRYAETLEVGSVEANSLETVQMHLRHFVRTLGADFPMPSLSLGDLQGHVARRAKEKGIRNRPLSPTTMRKEMASLRAAWNWGVQAGLLTGPFPNKGLKYPKTAEKPPFQTRQEIERQIQRGSLSEAEQKELWDCLFLGLAEIEELLAFVKRTAIQPWVYSAFCFAAHTGASDPRFCGQGWRTSTWRPAPSESTRRSGLMTGGRPAASRCRPSSRRPFGTGSRYIRAARIFSPSSCTSSRARSGAEPRATRGRERGRNRCVGGWRT